MKIIFLHLPKTGGQSVRQMLADAFGNAAICPARSNEELITYSVSELNRFQVFAPHGDWSLLDAVSGPRFVFSVFREPFERVLSYYFFLRKKSSAMTAEERSLPHHQGLRAAHDLPPDDYFLGAAPHLRAFLDDNYDNLYTYYFAGRTMDARRKLTAAVRRGALTQQAVLQNAIDNIEQLDGRYFTSHLDEIRSDLELIAGKKLKGSYRVNVNGEVPVEERLDRLKTLGASNQVISRLSDFCQYDRQIWSRYAFCEGDPRKRA